MTSAPRFRDWALAGIGVMFVVMGVVILPSDRNVGLSTIAMFGAAAALSIRTLMRKLRSGRQLQAQVRVAGGVPIRQSRMKAFVFGASALGLGIVLLLTAADAPLVIRICFWIVALAGMTLLAALALNLLPNEYLQFEPDGLVFGYRKWSVLLPWERIVGVSIVDVNRLAMLRLILDSHDNFQTTPPERHAQFLKFVARSREWLGGDICISTTHYSVDAPILAQAIARYRELPHARAELATPQLD